MTGPRGGFTPEFQTLGARRPRKDEIKQEPPAPVPAPGIDSAKFIFVDCHGHLITNDPRNDAANAQKDPADWPFGEVRIFNHH